MVRVKHGRATRKIHFKLEAPAFFRNPYVGQRIDGHFHTICQIQCVGNEHLVTPSFCHASHGIVCKQLVAVIRSKQTNHPDQPVVISADKAVRYEMVMQVMDLLQRNQVQRVGLMAVPKG